MSELVDHSLLRENEQNRVLRDTRMPPKSWWFKLAIVLSLIFSLTAMILAIIYNQFSLGYTRNIHRLEKQMDDFQMAMQENWLKALGLQQDEMVQVSRNLDAVQNRLKLQDQRLEQLRNALNVAKFRNENNEELIVPKVTMWRTCDEIRTSDLSNTDGYYSIDPDGTGIGTPPIVVFCDMTSGWTRIQHKETAVMVDRCSNSGCSSHPIQYEANMRQMIALVKLSTSCRQHFQFDCFRAPLHGNGTSPSWWIDREGRRQFFWAGNDPKSLTCQCGINGSCENPPARCNCDGSSPVLTRDEGYIENSDLLPITRVQFGHLTPLSTAQFQLGPFECSGRIGIEGSPSSCHDLWLTGETQRKTLNVNDSLGFRSVRCDFSKLPGEPGFEMAEELPLNRGSSCIQFDGLIVVLTLIFLLLLSFT